MSQIKIIKTPISKLELKKIAEERFGDLVKAAVDIEQEIMAVGGEFHMDEQITLFEKAGSKHQNVWGINIRPDNVGDEFIEFDSVINLKPNQGNRVRDIQDLTIKRRVVEVVTKLIQ